MEFSFPSGVCPVLLRAWREGSAAPVLEGGSSVVLGGSVLISARGISCCKLSTGAILKCHLSDLAKVQMHTGVEFAINS